MANQLQAFAFRLIWTFVAPDRKANLFAGSDEIRHAGRIEGQEFNIVFGANPLHFSGNVCLVDYSARHCRKEAVCNPLFVRRVVGFGPVR